ncbi:MAG: hypothetical protein GXP51_07230 [Deltaproteobacteria bacterium]|nr:hypothetical protein [Deltaproteobacteria bacterium]
MQIRNIFVLLAVLSGFFPASPAAALIRGYVSNNNQAVTQLEQGNYLAAIELLKKSLAAVPYDSVVQKNLLSAYQAAGQAFLQQKHYPQLSELMVEAQQFDDTQREFWSLRGYALLRMKKYYEAETELQEARGMGDPDARILYLLGELFYATDRLYEALDVLENALLCDPNNHAASALLEKVRRELAVEQGMDKEYGGHFVISFDGEQNDDLGRDVLDVLNEAYNWIGSQLDHYPEERVTVILYSRQQFSDLTDSPEWAGGLYDGKIRLPIGGISTVDVAVQSLLYHEYMHVVLRDIAGRNLPYWLNEGLAKLAEDHVAPQSLETLSRAREQQQLFRLAALEKSFSRFRGRQVALAYQQSYAVVRYLIDTYGWQHIRELVSALGTGASIGQAIEKSLGVYGLTYQTFEVNWRESG